MPGHHPALRDKVVVIKLNFLLTQFYLKTTYVAAALNENESFFKIWFLLIVCILSDSCV